ncbi:MAG TPA: amino acid adenylation domain-containing protein, partial [Blastocatellia bacterium]|nr:amino acid adenylation domain-containing protein [Blastocatellia bacterium]
MNPHDIEDICELTPLQQGILFHSLYNPESGVYFQQVACALRGNLDISAFQLAWQEAAYRHPILRTFFIYENPKKPLQVVARKVKITVERRDWRRLEPAPQAQELERFLREDRERGFDLTAPPLMRFTLITTGEQEYQFIWSSHHLLMDGWSRSLLLKEAFALYQSFCSDRQLQLEPARPFRQYITWLQQQDLSKAEEFWRAVLKGFTSPTPFVVDRPPSKQEGRLPTFGEQSKSVSKNTMGELQSVARRHQLTLNTIVQGAWAALLSRYSRQDDVIFGTTVSGRAAGVDGVETMIGLLTNTLPVRAQLSKDEVVVTWLKRLQAQQTEARQYEYSPLVKVQAWSEIPRGKSLFESLMAFENYPVDKSLREQMTQSALEIVGTRLVTQTNYPITLIIVPGQGLDLRLTYDEDRFDEETIKRLLGHFERLLEQMASDAQNRISELELLTEAEKRQVLEEWSHTGETEAATATFHEMFEQQVRRTPDVMAVAYDGHRLTYAELNRRANRLAHHLRRVGVGVETRLGIFLQRSTEMVVAILGALKAGGTYVPMDPEYPPARLEFMAEDAGISIILTDAAIKDRVSGLEGVTCIEVTVAATSNEREDNPGLKIESENLAYVIYTSGSTGRPKGVMIRHGSVVSYAVGLMKAVYGERQGAFRITLNAPLVFDASVKQLAQMFNGHTLYIVPEEIRRDGEALLAYIVRHGLQVLDSTPSQWKFLQAAGIESRPEMAPAIALVGGEKLDAETWKAFAESRQTAYFNMYGPTECTVNTTLCRVQESMDRPTIGRPLQGVGLYILDEYMRPVPIGVIGEIYIGGEGLARGYQGQPALTAEKFIPDPFSRRPGARLYASGDLARYSANADIEYMGRYDHQVKLRGIRIELREIEEAIAQHAGVERVVAHVKEGESGDKRLVAYLVPNAAGTLTLADIRTHCQANLPEYMVPAAFMMMDALPLTPNGKIDRQMLPEPYWVRPDLSEEFVAARTVVERLLADIWSQVLGIEQVGIYDNFFELGGDSILSIQIVARAKKAGLKISPRHVFERQTISELALVADGGRAAEAEQGVVTGAIPLTPIQRRFFEHKLPGVDHYNHAVLLEVRQRISPPLLREAIEKLVRHHDALRLRFKFEGPDWRQLNETLEETASLTVVDLSSLPDAGRLIAMRRAIDDTQTSLNISDGPLYRVTLMNLGDDRPGRLLFVIHHLAVDGVSWRILLEDLQAALRQARNAEEISLPAKTTSFKEWAERLTQYASSPEIAKEAAYWLRVAPSPAARLPIDHTRGNNTVRSEAAVSVALSVEETTALLKEVPALYNTHINDVLLMALAEAIERWTGDPTTLLDLEGHGREEILEGVDLSRTVGWFTTVFPVLLCLKGEPDTENRLKQIKEQLGRIPNGGIGYGLLRYAGGDPGVAEQLRSMPQPELSFNYLGQFDRLLAESSPFAAASESVGLSQNPDGNRRHLLRVHGSVSEGRLRMEWAYSRNLHQDSTIEHVAQAFIHSLRAIISHCKSAPARRLTLSDSSSSAERRLERVINGDSHVEDIYRLSPLQEGLLFYSLYAAGTGAYVTQTSFTVRGQINQEAFQRSWQEVNDRHPILRTSFLVEGMSKPAQVVRRKVKLPWQNQDWRNLPEPEQHQRLKEYLESDRASGFDLSEAPLMRLALIRLSEDTYKLVWSHHHLLLDGWSIPLLLKEVFAFYEAFCQGREARPEPPHPFRDYISWLGRQDEARAEAYWRQTLKGFTAPTPLVVDGAYEGSRDGEERFEEEREWLSERFTAELQLLSRQHKLTLNTLMQGAWALLLARYSGEQDVVFGTTVSGRPGELDGAELMVGLFINTLPVRIRVPRGASLAEWLREIQTQQAEMRQYEYSPLAQVQEWSDVARGQ